MVDAAESRSREGELLAGKYRLEHRLGAGGMGAVYRATNEVIGRTVAIKLLHDRLASDAAITTRFVREARAANLVRHPNVVDVLDVAQDEHGTPFIVQEFLEGEDLASHLDRVGGRLAALDAIALILPVIDAVAVAHSKGVIHRDLKPENVFLARSERGDVVPKVLDFGISKITSSDVKTTETGAALGTPAYMSPEQIQGARTLDARTDVWAIGVMLHEMIAGRLPFDAPNAGALFVEICTVEPIPLERAAPGVEPDVARIVARCLRRSPDARYPSAAELARDLRSVLEAKPIGATQQQAVSAPAPATVANVTSGGYAAKRIDRDALTVGAAPAPRHAPTEKGHGARAPVAVADPLDSPDVPLAVRHAAARRAASAASSRSDARTPEPNVATRSVTTIGIFVLVVVGTAGALAMLTTGTAGWPALAWFESLVAIRPAALVAAIALALFIAGAACALHGIRIGERSIAHLLIAAGCFSLSWFTAGSVARATASSVAGALGSADSLPTFFALSASLVPGGLALYGVRKANEAWRESVRVHRILAVFYANLAVIALYIAFQIARGAAPPSDDDARDDAIHDVRPRHR